MGRWNARRLTSSSVSFDFDQKIVRNRQATELEFKIFTDVI